MALIETRCDHAVRLQGLETCRQRIGSRARQSRLDLMKPQRALALEIAQDQEGPAFADHIEGARERTNLAIKLSHAPNVRLSFA